MLMKKLLKKVTILKCLQPLLIIMPLKKSLKLNLSLSISATKSWWGQVGINILWNFLRSLQSDLTAWSDQLGALLCVIVELWLLVTMELLLEWKIAIKAAVKDAILCRIQELVLINVTAFMRKKTLLLKVADRKYREQQHTLQLFRA